MQKTKLMAVTVLVLALTTVSLAQMPTQIPDRAKPWARLDLTIVGGGTVKPAPKPPTYPNYPFGCTVTLKATATDGWQFLRYEGAVKSASPVVTLVMNGNKQVKATFKLLPPTITGQSADQTLAEGDTATFYVQASGTRLRYQWRANGSVIPRATCSSLTFATALTDNGGAYTCQVSNPAGRVTSQGASLQVVPLLHPQLIAQVIDENNTAQVPEANPLWNAGNQHLISSRVFYGNHSEMVDITDPTNPLLETAPTAVDGAQYVYDLWDNLKLASTSGVMYCKNLIYLADDPHQPVPVGSITEEYDEIIYQPHDPKITKHRMPVIGLVTIDRANVVIAGGAFGAVVYDLTDPAKPQRKFWLIDRDEGYYVHDAVYDGNRMLYLALTEYNGDHTYTSHIVVYDITDWSLVSDWPFASSMSVRAIHNNYLYTSESDWTYESSRIVCRDVTNPMAPVVVSTLPGHYEKIVDTLLFCSSYNADYMTRVEIYFLSRQGTFVPIGSFQSDVLRYGGGLLPLDGCLYLSGRDDGPDGGPDYMKHFVLEVIDLQAP